MRRATGHSPARRGSELEPGREQRHARQKRDHGNAVADAVEGETEG
jgi:hypothetical protein